MKKDKLINAVNSNSRYLFVAGTVEEAEKKFHAHVQKITQRQIEYSQIVQPLYEEIKSNGFPILRLQEYKTDKVLYLQVLDIFLKYLLSNCSHDLKEAIIFEFLYFKYEKKFSVQAVLHNFRNHKDMLPVLHRSLAIILVKYLTKDSAPLVKELISDTTLGESRYYLYGYFGKHSLVNYGDYLLSELFREEEPIAKCEIIRSLGKMKYYPALQPLSKLINSNDKVVSKTCEVALNRLRKTGFSDSQK